MRIDLPECVRKNFADQKLPKWVRDIFNLNDDATFIDLPQDLDVNTMAELQAVTHFVQLFFTRKLSGQDFQKEQCFPHSDLSIDLQLIRNMNLSNRTRNALSTWLENEVELRGPVKLNELTYGSLKKIPNLGSKSILEALFELENIDFSPSQPGNIESVQKKESIIKSATTLFKKIESFNYIDMVFLGDPRFPDLNALFQLDVVNDDTSLNIIVENLRASFAEWPESRIRSLIASLSNMIEKLSYLSALNLENQFETFIRHNYKRPKEKNLLALFDRFGINDFGKITLEECGKQAGITRERVRQLEVNIFKNAGNISGEGPIYLPGMNLALNIIRDSFGAVLIEVQKAFSDGKITNLPVSADAVLIFAHLLRYDESDISIEMIRSGERIVVGDKLNANSVLTVISKLSSRNGIADANLVYGILSENNDSITIDEIKNVARGSGAWVSLDHEERWWVLTNIQDMSRNRLLNISEKVLSVCNPISVEQLKGGFNRLATYRNSSSKNYQGNNNITPPSKEAILRFFERTEGYTVTGDEVYSEEMLEYTKVLEGVERGIVEALLTSPSSLMSREEIMRICTKKGLNESSVSVYLTYSPIVQHVGQDAFKIIGKVTSASSLSAHQQSLAEKSKSKRLLLCDWDEGLIRFVVRCPAFTANLVVGAPSSMKKLLVNKKFECYDQNSNKPSGNIGVNEEGAIYGMSTYCRIFGLEENDILVMKFDPLQNIALLSTDTIDNYLNIIE